MVGSIRVNVLGEFSVHRADGGAARFRTTRAGEVVALLVLRESRRMLRDELALDIWPDADRSSRLANLRPALSYARQALGDPGILIQEGEMIALSPSVVSDWQDVEALEAKAQSADGEDHQLIALYALYEALREPLLRGWRSEWIDRYRDYYSRRQAAVLRQLAETCESLGDWPTALEYARKLSEADPFDEDGVRLQIRALGALGRPAEAQAEYTRYSKLMMSELGLKASVGLRQLSDTVVSGRFQAKGTKATAAQKDLIWQILDMLVDEDPERVLHLLSSPKLNWSIATSGPDLRALLERLFRDTTGWSKDRKGVATRLLQIYVQEVEPDLAEPLAKGLLAHGDSNEKVAGHNFLALARQHKGDNDVAEKHLVQAIAEAESGGNKYLAAVSLANLAFLKMRLLRLDEAELEMRESIRGLALAKEPNALLSSAFTMSGHTLTAWLAGDFAKAKELSEDWLQFCHANGMSSFDSTGKGIYALICANGDLRTARTTLLSAVHSAMAERCLEPQLAVLPPLVAATRIAFSEEDADQFARLTENIFAARGYASNPAIKKMLGSSSSTDTTVLTLFELFARIRTVVLRST